MASNRNDNTSTESFQRQGAKLNESSSQESPTYSNQLEAAVKESARILQHITGNSKGFSIKLGSWGKKKRIPRQYYINDEKSILIILQGDITRTKVDAIVNAANEHMTGGSGVDGIIHRAAGNDLYKACKAHKQIHPGVRLPTGHSRILLSYDMISTTHYIINTAGPMYYSREAEECAKQLSSCYKTALALADLYDLQSIGFTAISCGIFGYPANDGAKVALETVNKNAASVPVVVFVLWDDDIYDAWVEEAEELNLTPFDPESPITEKSAKPADVDYQEKITKNPTTNSNTQPSSPEFNPTVTDLSTSNETDDKAEESLLRLPSVPISPSDTQSTVTMDQDNDPTDSNPALTSQRTGSVEMTNVASQNEDTTTADNSEHSRIPKEATQLHDEKAEAKTTDNDSDPSAAADSVKNSNTNANE